LRPQGGKYIDQLQKARNYAFLLLKYRPRSEYEIRWRLKRKKFDEAVIKETISFLKEREFIADEGFTRAWIESRLKKPLGLNRIRSELKLKGIDKQIIESQINRIKEQYNEEGIISQIIKTRIERLNLPGLKAGDSSRAGKRQFRSSHGLKPGDSCKGLKGLDVQSAKRRLFAYLLRRGFSPDAISDAISQL
jgi:regulatory protein